MPMSKARSATTSRRPVKLDIESSLNRTYEIFPFVPERGLVRNRVDRYWAALVPLILYVAENGLNQMLWKGGLGDTAQKDVWTGGRPLTRPVSIATFANVLPRYRALESFLVRQ